MAERHDDTGVRRTPDELDRARALRGKRDQLDSPAGGLLKRFEERPARVSHRIGRVCSSVSFLLGEKRAFEVDSDDPAADVRKTVAGLCDRSQAVKQLVDRGRDQGGAEPSCPERALVADDARGLLDGELRAREGMPPRPLI